MEIFDQRGIVLMLLIIVLSTVHMYLSYISVILKRTCSLPSLKYIRIWFVVFAFTYAPNATLKSFYCMEIMRPLEPIQFQRIHQASNILNLSNHQSNKFRNKENERIIYRLQWLVFILGFHEINIISQADRFF